MTSNVIADRQNGRHQGQVARHQGVQFQVFAISMNLATHRTEPAQGRNAQAGGEADFAPRPDHDALFGQHLPGPDALADLGVALDGDGDRLVMADAKGRIFDGDQLLYLLALDAQLRQDRCEGVVGTVMSNFGLEQALLERGMDPGGVRLSIGIEHPDDIIRDLDEALAQI